MPITSPRKVIFYEDKHYVTKFYTGILSNEWRNENDFRTYLGPGQTFTMEYVYENNNRV